MMTGNAKLSIAPGGDRSLRVEDFNAYGAIYGEVAGNSQIDIADNIFIDGNNPSARGSTANPLPPVATISTLQSLLRSTYNGQLVTANRSSDPSSSSQYGIAYANGAGMLSKFPAGTFHGRAFDSNDFIFYATRRGDTDFDRDVDFDDLLSVAQHYGQTTIRGSIDGNVDNPASNSAVDFDDLLLLAQNFQQSYVAAVPAKTTTTARKPAVKGLV